MFCVSLWTLLDQRVVKATRFDGRWRMVLIVRSPPLRCSLCIQAIEIGLWHANCEALAGLTQVILIGDAAPNTPDEVRSKRAGSSLFKAL